MEIEVECPSCGARIVVRDTPNLRVAACRYCEVTWVADVETITRVKSLTELGEYYKVKERQSVADARHA